MASGAAHHHSNGIDRVWCAAWQDLQTHVGAAAAHCAVTGPRLMTDQANGPPHFTALSPAVAPTQISKPLRYFLTLEALFLVSGVTVTALMGVELAWR